MISFFQFLLVWFIEKKTKTLVLSLTQFIKKIELSFRIPISSKFDILININTNFNLLQYNNIDRYIVKH